MVGFRRKIKLQGKGGAALDWNKTEFPAAFKAKAKKNSGFVFTAFMKTTDGKNVHRDWRS